MTVNGILPADIFIVLNNTILSDQDRKLLIMLYQPIVGSSAINLYFVLWSYLDKLELISKEITHHSLMNNTGYSLDVIIESREKLEAIGLVKTYKNSSEYIYELYSPLSANEFLTNPVLSTALLSNVGKSEYEDIIKYFKNKKINLDKYEDISVKFSDIFKFKKSDLISEVESNIRKTNHQKLRILTDIDINEIFSSIPTEIIDEKNLSKDDKDLIYKLSFIYNLDNEELSNVIINSVKDNKLNKSLLRKNASNYYKLESTGKLPTLVYYTQPDILKTRLDSNDKRSKQIYAFENTTPYDFLNNKSNITKKEQEILEYLLIDLDFTPGVVNVLIDYALRTNNNKLIKGYVEAIASQWKKSKIKTVPDAMKIAEDEYKSRLKIKNKTKKSEEIKPDWLDKKIDSKVPSKDSEKKIDSILSKYE